MIQEPSTQALSRRTAPVIFVEDDEDDAFFMKKAFKGAECANRLIHLSDGQEVVDYLSGSGKYQDRTAYPLPFLIIMDLKMPRLGGFDLLRWIRKQEQTEIKFQVVVILTSSNQKADREKAQDLGANAYHVKPSDFESLMSLLHEITNYWILKNHSVISG